jgi:hypothetical protein
MWQSKENQTQTNENLKNTLERCVNYKQAPNNHQSMIKITQLLSESSYTFDVPCYLLYVKKKLSIFL